MSDFKLVKLIGNPISLNVNINPRGAYDNGTTYAVGDSVSYLGSSYIAEVATTGNLPTNTSFWQLLVSKGDTGSAGTTDHLLLSNIGTRTHTQLESDIAGKANTSHVHALSNITQSGATTSQVPTWNGSAWVPSTPSGGSGSPGGSNKEVQYNASGSFDGDSNFVWDDASKNLGIQKATPLAPLHVAGILGESISPPATASATLVLDTAITSPTTYTPTEILSPVSPTSATTTVVYIEAATSGSGSDSYDSGSSIFAQGQTWYYKLYSYRLSGGVFICSPTFLDITFADTFNDMALVSNTLNWTIATNCDGFILTRDDSIGNPQKVKDIGYVSSYVDFGFTDTEAYVLSQYQASGAAQASSIYQYSNLGGAKYNSLAGYDVGGAVDSSGQYFLTTTSFDVAVNDGFIAKTYNGYYYDIATTNSFLDYGQTIGSISNYTPFSSIAFPYMNTTLTSGSYLSSAQVGSGGYTADGSTYYYQVLEYKIHPVTSIKYVDAGYTFNIADDNSSGTFVWSIDVNAGDGDGRIIQRSMDGGSTYSLELDMTSTTNALDANNWAASNTYPLMSGYSGLNRDFKAYGKKTSPVKYSTATTDHSFTDTNQTNGYVIKHEYTGIGNADIVKVLQTATGIISGSILVGATGAYQFSGALGDTIFTPSSTGFLSNGSNLNRVYKFRSTKTISGTVIYSSTFTTATTTDPNDGQYYYINLANAAVTGCTFKTSLQINGGSVDYKTHSSLTLADESTTTWSNAGSTITPTLGAITSAIFERLQSSSTDIGIIKLRNTVDSVVRAFMDFEYTVSGAALLAGRAGVCPTGHFNISSYNGGLEVAANGFVDSPHTRIATEVDFNVQASSSYRMRLRGALVSYMMYANCNEDTVYFGTQNLNYNPTSAVAIKGTTSDKALVLCPATGAGTHDVLMELRNDSNSVFWTMDASGKTGIGVAGSTDARLRLASGDASVAQLKFQGSSTVATGVAYGLSAVSDKLWFSDSSASYKALLTSLATSTSTYYWRSDSNGNPIADNTLALVSGVVLAANLQFQAKQGLALDAGKDISMGSNSKITGNINLTYSGVSSNTTLNATHYCLNATANSFNMTLPTAVGIAGRVYVLKNSGTGVITINTTSSQTIDGGASGTITMAQYAPAIRVMSNGANWILI
jgi:hypothetical protein